MSTSAVELQKRFQEKHEGAPLVKISRENWSDKKETLGRQRYELAKASDKNATPALVVDGEKAGETVYVKVKPKPAAAAVHNYEAERKKEEEKRRVRGIVCRRILQAILAKVTQIDRDDLVALLTDRIQDLRGEGAKHLAECLNVPRGAPGGLVGQLAKWHGRDFGKAIVGVLVADELSGWFERADSLYAAAKRYKVDPAKVRAEVEAELKKTEKPEPAKPTAAPPAAKEKTSKTVIGKLPTLDQAAKKKPAKKAKAKK